MTTIQQDDAVRKARLRHGLVVGPPAPFRHTEAIRIHALQTLLEEVGAQDTLTPDQRRTLAALTYDLHLPANQREWLVRDATVIDNVPILRYVADNGTDAELPIGEWVVTKRRFLLRPLTLLLIGGCAALEILVGLGIVHHMGGGV
jgi:hypothetical protein